MGSDWRHTKVAEDGLGRLVAESRHRFRGRSGWFNCLFLTFWFAMWIVSLVYIARGLSDGEPSLLPALAAFGFLGLWIPAGIYVGVLLVKGLYGGRESVVLDSSGVVIHRAVGRFGFTRRYDTRAMRDFRAVHGTTLNGSEYVVAFTHRGRKVSFGDGMDRTDAGRVAQAFADRLRGEMIGPLVDDHVRGGKIEFRRTGGGWHSGWDVLGVFFISSFFLVWLVGGILALRHDSPGGWAEVALVAVWLLVTVASVLAFVGPGLERYTLSVGAGELEIRRAFGPFGRTSRYDRTQIKNLRVVPVETEDGPADDDFEFAFQYGQKTVRFGVGLTEAAAEAALKDLVEQLHNPG